MSKRKDPDRKRDHDWHRDRYWVMQFASELATEIQMHLAGKLRGRKRFLSFSALLLRQSRSLGLTPNAKSISALIQARAAWLRHLRRRRRKTK
jgi:C4-dicarboxylate-specific signal transduction histidine kinase